MRQRIRSTAPRKKRRAWFVFAAVIAVLIIALTCAVATDAANRAELRAIEMSSIDFATLSDGTYIGAFQGENGNLRDATVEVTVLNGELTSFRILKGAVDEQGAPTDLGNGLTIIDLFKRVQETGSLQVDVISGATLTSNAHLKALEDALKQAQETP